MPDVISANRLADGIVVFYDPHGRWAEALAAAEVYNSKPEIEMALAQAKADEGKNLVVDVYNFAVTTQGGIAPATLRDRIRAAGPTIAYN